MFESKKTSQDHHHAAGDVLGDEHVAAPSEPPFGAQSLWQ